MPKRVKVADLQLDGQHSIWIAKAYRKITKYDKTKDGALVWVEGIAWPLQMKAKDEVWAVDEAEVPPSAHTTTPDWNELLDDLEKAVRSLKKPIEEEKEKDDA